MMKKCIFELLLLSTAFLSLLSCASKPDFKGDGDLCGLVLDENNTPVKDFVIYCKAADFKTGSRKIIEAKMSLPVTTNESGLFVFYSLPSGDYYFTGQKEAYLKIQSDVYHFNDRTKIICLQTMGLKSAVLNAEEALNLKQFDKAQKLLENLYFEKDSDEAIFFKNYLEKIEEKKNEKE